jgi:hypothetical protein
MPAPSPPFKTILELVLWNGLQACSRIIPDVISVIKMPSFQYFLLSSGTEKSHWRLDRVNKEGIPAQLLAKNSLTESAQIQAPTFSRRITKTHSDNNKRETAIDQQQHSCEALICQRHQTILRFLRQAHGGEFANFIVRPRMIMWVAFNWFRIGCSEGFCEYGNEPWGLIKIGEFQTRRATIKSKDV